MKTMKLTLFTIAFTVAMMVAGSAARAGIQAPTVLQCAESMVYDMRYCSREQPSLVDKTNSKNGRTDAAKTVKETDARTADKVARKAKTSEEVQGFNPTSCNQMAFWNYLSCIEGGFGGVEPSGGKKTDDTPSVKAEVSPSKK